MLQTKTSTELICFALYNLKVGRIWKTHTVILKQIFFFLILLLSLFFFISTIDDEWFGNIMMLGIPKLPTLKSGMSIKMKN